MHHNAEGKSAAGEGAVTLRVTEGEHAGRKWVRESLSVDVERSKANVGRGKRTEEKRTSC